jgi:hypothetical protein
VKVAIIGSRDFAALELVTALVAELPPGTLVVSGRARGVDATARRAAEARGLPFREVPADWDTLDARAGFARNGEIVGPADRVEAFLAPCRKVKCAVGRCPGDGWTHGTMDAIRKALAAQKGLGVTYENGVRKAFGPANGLPDFGASGL